MADHYSWEPNYRYILGQVPSFRREKLEVKLVHSTGNGTRVVALPADIQYNQWNYLAIR